MAHAWQKSEGQEETTMGLFDKLFKKEEEISLPAVEVSDEAIVAVADGEMIDVTTVSDPVFAEK